jgi:hypothetical protein
LFHEKNVAAVAVRGLRFKSRVAIEAGSDVLVEEIG